MADVEAVIDVLEGLDALRKEASSTRADGIETFVQYCENPTATDSPKWSAAGDKTEHALARNVLRLASRQGRKTPALSAPNDKANEHVVFSAALTLKTLARIPGEGLGAPAAEAFARVLHEVHRVNVGWTFGAASSGVAESSAFLTNECAHALAILKRAFRRTAELLRLIEAFDDKREPAFKKFRLEDWWEANRHAKAIAMHVAMTALADKTILKIPELGEALQSESQVGHWVENSIKAVTVAVETQFKDAIREFELAAQLSVKYAPAGQAVVQRFLKLLQELLDGLGRDGLVGAIRALERVQLALGRMMIHSQNFLSSIIDREIAAYHLSPTSCDFAELLFACAGFGSISNDWADQRLTFSMDLLHRALRHDGSLPLGRPFYATTAGLKLFVEPFETTRTLAYLYRHLPRCELNLETARKLMRTFQALRVPGCAAWRSIHGRPEEPSVWVSAIAIKALAAVERALAVRINAQLKTCFTVKEPGTLGLDEILQADFGMKRTSTAVVLQRMRAHICGGLGAEQEGLLHTLVLYGPPGTGKTTLAEALATTCRVPLFTITPSDIIVSGEEGVERRARCVFRALSILSDAVILFDEFDSLIRDRRGRNRNSGPVTTFGFVTPGMLTKLRELYDRSKNSRVAYILATNMYFDLEPAAVRPGRFDNQIGIYPPDALSRAGALLSALLSSGRSESQIDRERFWHCIEVSNFVAAKRLLEHENLTINRKKRPRPSSMFGHILREEKLEAYTEADDSFAVGEKDERATMEITEVAENRDVQAALLAHVRKPDDASDPKPMPPK